jgi:hypothetical protein
MHADGQFAGPSSVPPQLEVMGQIGMSNHPMAGASVALGLEKAMA